MGGDGERETGEYIRTKPEAGAVSGLEAAICGVMAGGTGLASGEKTGSWIAGPWVAYNAVSSSEDI